MDRILKVKKIDDLYNLYEYLKEGYIRWHRDSIRDVVEDVYFDAKYDGEISMLINLYGNVKAIYIPCDAFDSSIEYLAYNMDLYIINFLYKSLKNISYSRFTEYARLCLDEDVFENYFKLDCLIVWF